MRMASPVNVVRWETQDEVLRSIYAKHVVDSSSPGNQIRLRTAMSEAGATIAFDPIAGGGLGNDLLAAMQSVAGDDMID
ncbi:hypothetical protein [Sphingomonas sp. CLY1604]|uniref:hypothetical protein n=1 Tax=Sphingomonas sp. CLY1604 TaxID=3457786 RepID=UPI003FD6FA4F